MKKNIILSTILVAVVLAGCSGPKTESAKSNAAMQKILNQNPSGHISSIDEAEHLNPNTGEIETPKDKNGQK